MPPFPILKISLALLILPSFCGAATLDVKCLNPSAIARSDQTIELKSAVLGPLGAVAMQLLHVQDGAGKEVLCQAADSDLDPLHQPDTLIFQTNFGASETKSFRVVIGAKQAFTKEQYRAFGRFVRERFDDFAWENDRIAHRTYGQALETWEGEPLCSSTIDIWSKRVPRMVVNDWYLTDDFHVDHGEGADFYSAGPSRGCGGSGLWADEKSWVSRNFVNSRVLTNGPIRVMFELEYAPYDVNGVTVSEVKRVTLDAGQQFDHYQSHYKTSASPGSKVTLIAAVGLKKTKDERVTEASDGGWLAKWEGMGKKAGHQGLAVIVPAGGYAGLKEDALNHLVLTPVDADGNATWWAGFAWDKAGVIGSEEAWKSHVREFAENLSAPIQITVTADR